MADLWDEGVTYLGIGVSAFAPWASSGVDTATQAAIDAKNKVKKEAQEAADGIKKAIAWAPWLIGGGLLVAGLIVAIPYVVPFIQVVTKK